MKNKCIVLFLIFLIIVSGILINFKKTLKISVNDLNFKSFSTIESFGEYIVEDTYIKYIDVNTTVESFIEKSSVNDENIIVTDQFNNKKTNDEIVVTGSKAQITINGSTNIYTLVVVGDINGDGISNIIDIFQLNKYRINKIEFDRKQEIAADIDYNGEVNVLDLFKINKYRLDSIESLLPENNDVIGVKLTEDYLELEAGSEHKMEAIIRPLNATNKNVIWMSSNTDVAEVNELGVVTCKSGGETVITVRTVDGNFEASARIKVYDILINQINLSTYNLELEKGKSYKINSTILPENATNKILNWMSSNENVAIVDSDGNVTAVGEGTTFITVETTDGSNILKSIEVKVIIPVESITLNKDYVEIDLSSETKTCKLKASIFPDTATNKTVTWSSSNKSIAIVESNGLITAKSNGTVTITAITSNGKKAECTIKVQTSPTNIYFTKNKTDDTKYESILKGSTKSIKAVIEPSTANVNTNITYSLSDGNSKVASVNSSTGSVIAKQAGVITLNAKTDNGLTASIRVNVKIGNNAVSRSSLTSTNNDTIYSQAVPPYKKGNTRMHMQGFDIDSNGAIFYAGNCDCNDRPANSETKCMSYISHFYKSTSKNARPTQEGISLIYVGHQDSIDVEEDGNDRYIWGTTFASNIGEHGITSNYAVSRIKYQSEGRIVFGPGRVIEKDNEKNKLKTYDNIEADNFVYYGSDGKIRKSIVATLDEENGLLCINFGVNFYLFDLQEALSLPDEKQSNMEISKYEDPYASTNIVTEYIDFYAKNLGYKKQDDGTYAPNIIPLTVINAKDKVPNIYTDSRQGVDLDGDYIYFIEGANQPTRITGFDYMFNYNGNIPALERTAVKASYTKEFYEKMGNLDVLRGPYTTENGTYYFFETEGIKVKNGTVYCGYMSKDYNDEGGVDKQATILKIE